MQNTVLNVAESREERLLALYIYCCLSMTWWESCNFTEIFGHPWIKHLQGRLNVYGISLLKCADSLADDVQTFNSKKWVTNRFECIWKRQACHPEQTYSHFQIWRTYFKLAASKSSSAKDVHMYEINTNLWWISFMELFSLLNQCDLSASPKC